MQVVEAQGHLLRPAQDLPKVDDMLLQVVEETAVDHILCDDSVVGRDYAGSVELDNVSVAESGEHLRLLGRGREQWEGQGAVGGAGSGGRATQGGSTQLTVWSMQHPILTNGVSSVTLPILEPTSSYAKACATNIRTSIANSNSFFTATIFPFDFHSAR